jgi:hypothetical protein
MTSASSRGGRWGPICVSAPAETFRPARLECRLQLLCGRLLHGSSRAVLQRPQPDSKSVDEGFEAAAYQVPREISRDRREHFTARRRFQFQDF